MDQSKSSIYKVIADSINRSFIIRHQNHPADIRNEFWNIQSRAGKEMKFMPYVDTIYEHLVPVLQKQYDSYYVQDYYVRLDQKDDEIEIEAVFAPERDY